MERILHVFGQANRGGAETRTMDIYREIDKSKYQFDFLCFGEYRQFDYSKEIEALGGRLLFVNGKFPMQIFKIVRLIKEEGPFLAVHSHISHYSAVIMLAAKMAKVKGRIVHSRTSSDDSSRGIRKLYFSISSYLIDKCANIFLSCSREAGEYLFNAGALCKREFIVIPNAINLENYKKITKSKADIRDIMGISENAVVIGHVGRLEKVKNHNFLIDVFNEYKKKNENAVLVCVGEGKYRETIEHKIQQMHLEKSVKLIGLREDVPLLIHMFDVFVMPSFYEGIPGVVIEAQAAGIPCLLSDTISREIDIGTGLLEYASLSDDIKTWCEKINNLLAGEHISKRDSIQILELNGYSAAASTAKLQSIYEGIKRS